MLVREELSLFTTFSPTPKLDRIDELNQKIQAAKQKGKQWDQQLKEVEAELDLTDKKVEQLLREDLKFDIPESYLIVGQMANLIREDLVPNCDRAKQLDQKQTVLFARIDLLKSREEAICKETNVLRDMDTQIIRKVDEVRQDTEEGNQYLIVVEQEVNVTKQLIAAAQVEQREIKEQIQDIRQMQNKVENQDKIIQLYQNQTQDLIKSQETANKKAKSTFYLLKVFKRVGKDVLNFPWLEKSSKGFNFLCDETRVNVLKITANTWGIARNSIKQVSRLINLTTVKIFSGCLNLTKYVFKQLRSYIWSSVSNEPISWIALTCFSYCICPKPISSAVASTVAVIGICYLIKNRYFNG
jgi:hypothetical protein